MRVLERSDECYDGAELLPSPLLTPVYLNQENLMASTGLSFAIFVGAN